MDADSFVVVSEARIWSAAELLVCNPARLGLRDPFSHGLNDFRQVEPKNNSQH
jgi:hypothetical protein